MIIIMESSTYLWNFGHLSMTYKVAPSYKATKVVGGGDPGYGGDHGLRAKNNSKLILNYNILSVTLISALLYTIPLFSIQFSTYSIIRPI